MEEEELPRSLLIIYATETGNSLDVAERIAKDCRRRHFHTRLIAADAYPLEDLITEHLIIFVLATTGNGTEPQMLLPLWQLLIRSDLPADLFEGIQYAVFGLGDSAYERFCWASKKLARRLQSLGAEEILEAGCGDEQERFGTDTALGPWMDGLFEALERICPLPVRLELLPAVALEPPRASFSIRGSSVTVDDDATSALAALSLSGITTSPLSDTSNPMKPRLLSIEIDQDLQAEYHDATVAVNRRITADGWYQDVRHIEFTFADDIRYDPGDIAVIHPMNAASDVDALLKRFDWTDIADQQMYVQSTSHDQPLPHTISSSPQTLRIIFTAYLDIGAIPRRSFFELLRHFTKDELEKEKLQDFCTAEGQDDLYDYVNRVRRTILEVLLEFRHVRIPLDYVFDLFPPLRPRQFSIASSVETFPRQIHLCIAIVRYRSKLKVPRKGVCTTYLAGLVPSSGGETTRSDAAESSDSLRQNNAIKLRIGIKKGSITLPDADTPLICVGPGTGIAPMRAILQKRIGAAAKENMLYFGCRSASKDLYYEEEWQSYEQEGQLTLRVAHSRDQVDKQYVQHLIQEDAKRIWQVLGEQRGWLIISGSSNKMPTAVKKAVESAAQLEGGLSPEEAAAFIAQMEREGRLIEECWS